jgi:hypothetical protein
MNAPALHIGALWLDGSQEEWVYRTHLRLHGKICSVDAARRNVERLRDGLSPDAVRRLMESEPPRHHLQANLRGELFFRQLMGHDAENFVSLVYKVVLSRVADLQGAKFYEQRINAGVAPAQVLLELLNSAEARSAGQLDEAKARFHAQLAALCNNAVGGSTDANGIPQGWKSFFRAGREDFVQIAYRYMLGRSVDPLGRAFYVGELARGRSKFSILLALAMSDEAHQVSRSRWGHRLFWLFRSLRRS